MEIATKFFLTTTIFAILFFTSCDRLDMYDIASQKSRTAYAIAYDGVNYTLIITNIHYTKSFKSLTPLPTFALGSYGMAVNDKKEVIVYNTLNLAAFSEYDLTQWKATSSYPQSTFLLGFNNKFIYFFSPNLYFYDNQIDNWISFLSLSTLTSGIFKGNNGQLYAYEYDGTTSVTIYEINEYNTNLLINITLPSTLSGTFQKGYKTKNAFYTINKDTKRSICKISSSMIQIVNETVDTGNYYIDTAVTDDDLIYCLVTDASSNIFLKQIISDSNYPVIASFGSTGNFIMDSLDDRHVVIASSDNTDGYNGLFIYDVDENKIVKHITNTDVIALYVLR